MKMYFKSCLFSLFHFAIVPGTIEYRMEISRCMIIPEDITWCINYICKFSICIGLAEHDSAEGFPWSNSFDLCGASTELYVAEDLRSIRFTPPMIRVIIRLTAIWSTQEKTLLYSYSLQYKWVEGESGINIYTVILFWSWQSWATVCMCQFPFQELKRNWHTEGLPWSL